MDKDALDVIREAVHKQLFGDCYYDEPTDCGYYDAANDTSHAVVAALGANGYVVVPRHLLDELLLASYAIRVHTEHSDLIDDLEDAERAVVEAVGPTREDQ